MPETAHLARFELRLTTERSRRSGTMGLGRVPGHMTAGVAPYTLPIVSSGNENLKNIDHDRLLAILRRKFPVWRDDALGNFVLTRHDDVRALLADRSLLKDSAKADPESLIMKA